jgi:transcriptional regulator with XRE-family HTH domain
MATHLSLPFSWEKSRGTRERLGMTRPALAKRCEEIGHKVSTEHLRRIETGMSIPSAPLLKAIADAMGVEVDDLLDQTKAGAA